jgi:hypothetical protein
MNRSACSGSVVISAAYSISLNLAIRWGRVLREPVGV